MAVASGNGGCTIGVSWPACLSTALAVGAVFDDEICTLPAPWPFDCASTKMSYGKGQCMASGCEQDTKKDRITCYTDSGDKLGVFAPSDCAKTTKMGGGYEDCFNGTSAATPYVAGAAALLSQAYPYLGASAIRAALEHTGNPRTDGRNGITRNRIDVLAAFDYLATYCIAPGPPQGLAPSASLACGAGTYTLTWGGGGSADTYRVERSRTPDFANSEVSTTTATSLALTFTAEAPATLYHRVRAERECGSYSPWSSVATVPYYPACPHQPRRHLRQS
jgi:subtilisin family serine protease